MKRIIDNIRSGHVSNYIAFITAIVSLVGYILAIKNPEDVRSKYIIENSGIISGIIVTIVSGLVGLGKK